MSSQGLIGPFFFEENGSAVTVNGARYRIMLQTFFFPQLKALVGKNKLSQQWYQQDGATAHTANNTLDVLRNKFGDRLISLRTEKEWSPYSPDLNPPDFYIWGYLKDKVYSNPVPRDLNQLKVNIANNIRNITRETLAKVTANFRMRMDRLLETDGRHIEHFFVNLSRHIEHFDVSCLLLSGCDTKNMKMYMFIYYYT